MMEEASIVSPFLGQIRHFAWISQGGEDLRPIMFE
jgi:hypothetical protein